jgi:hypothetical protein
VTTLKYLVQGSTIPSKSPSWAINDPQLTDVHARLADPKRSLLTASLELAGVWTSSPPDVVAFKKFVRIAAFLYAAQAAIGFSVGFVLPWLIYFGVIDR